MSRSCRHAWLPNNGRGGDPEFRVVPDRFEGSEVMPARCRECGVLAWFDRANWEALEAQTENRAQRRRRERVERKAQEADRRQREEALRALRKNRTRRPAPLRDEGVGDA